MKMNKDQWDIIMQIAKLLVSLPIETMDEVEEYLEEKLK